MSFEFLLGNKTQPKPWMKPTPIKILPNLKERRAFTDFQHIQRFTFYSLFFSAIAATTAAALQLVLSLVTKCRSNNRVEPYDGDESRYALLNPGEIVAPEIPEERHLKTAGRILEKKSAFDGFDIWFTWYTASYQLFCAGLVVWSLRNDCIDIDFGMDFEVYVPWIVEAMLVHLVTLSVSLWFLVYARNHQDDEIPSPFMRVLTSVAPFLSERFNLLRDWVTIGIYLTDGHPIAKVSAAIVLVSIFVCIGVLFSDPKLCLSMRVNYWPLAKSVMSLDDQPVYWQRQVMVPYRKLRIALEESSARSDAKPRCLPERIQPGLRPALQHYGSCLVRWQLRLLCEMDLATQEHKVVNTIYGEIPQAVAALLFVSFSRWSHFVVICLILYVSKVILLILVRPYVLCYLADASFHWTHLKPNDLDRALFSRSSYAFFCAWERRALQALYIVRDLREGADVAAAAVRGMTRLLMEVDDEESATMVAHFINMLREVHNELPDLMNSHEGVKIFRDAIVQAIMQMSEGIEKKDIIAPPIITGGNLGYLPTGGDLEEVEGMVRKMHAGEHDVVKLLTNYGAWKQARIPVACDSKNDLLIFFTDLEPDDVMAVAQLWQWKMETLRLSAEPIVIFGADFADKDNGTVFEKKTFIAHLMLGISKLWVLTPNEQAKSISKHPLAPYWEGLRNDEMDGLCQRIADFEGSTIHFYVMAPGRGNIEAMLTKIKSSGASFSDKTWKIQVYSGAFNMRGMTDGDVAAMKEIGSKSDVPLLDSAKFPFFGGKNYHSWASSFTTFAPDKFPVDLNLVAHPLVPAALKLFNDEHNMGLVAPHKLHKVKKLTSREQERLSAIKPLYKMETITQYCKALQDDFSLFSKIDDFKKSTVASFAFGCCDSPLADQLIFLQEFLLERQPRMLKFAEGEWVVSSSGHTRVDINGTPQASCSAIQPVLAEPLNESHLNFCRDKLQEYLFRHLQSLHFVKSGRRSGELVLDHTASGRRGNPQGSRDGGR